MLGFLDRCLRNAIANCIYGHRLLTEDVFACFNSRGQVHRTEAGRCGQKHNVHAAIDELLVSVQPDEALVGGNFDAVCKFFAETLNGCFNLGVQNVGDGNKLGVVVGT